MKRMKNLVEGYDRCIGRRFSMVITPAEGKTGKKD
jgi:hypothetical protein